MSNPDLEFAIDLHTVQIPEAVEAVRHLTDMRDKAVAKAWAANLELTYADIADRLGCSKSYIQVMMEAGRDQPHPPSRRRRTGKPLGRPTRETV